MNFFTASSATPNAWAMSFCLMPSSIAVRNAYFIRGCRVLNNASIPYGILAIALYCSSGGCNGSGNVARVSSQASSSDRRRRQLTSMQLVMWVR